MLKQTPQALLRTSPAEWDPHWEQFTDGDPCQRFFREAKYAVRDLAGRDLPATVGGSLGSPVGGGGQYFSYLNGARIFWGPGVRMKLRKQHCAVWSKVPK